MSRMDERMAMLEGEMDNLRMRVAELEAELEAERRKNITYPHLQPLQVPSGCSVCGLKMDGPMGYVCSHPNCPTKITC